MPKEKINRWAIRNKRLRAENHFNRVMCEYITYKYGEIAMECTEFYDQLMEKYPTKSTKTYKGSKEFKKWVSSKIAAYCNENTEQETRDEHAQQETSDEHAQQETRDEHAQQETSDEHAEQETRDEHAQQETSDEHAQQETSDEHAQQETSDEHAEQARGNLINQALLLADNEVENIIAELENGDVPLDTNDDEGIHLDLYEEFVGDISSLDMEIELNDNIFW